MIVPLSADLAYLATDPTVPFCLDSVVLNLPCLLWSKKVQLWRGQGRCEGSRRAGAGPRLSSQPGTMSSVTHHLLLGWAKAGSKPSVHPLQLCSCSPPSYTNHESSREPFTFRFPIMVLLVDMPIALYDCYTASS